MVGVPVLLGHGQQDHGLADENAPLGLRRSHVLVHMEVGIMQRLDLLRQNPPAVFGTHGEEPFPDVIAVTARPKLDGPVTGEMGVAAPERLLHGRTDFAEIIAPDRPEPHVPASNRNSGCSHA